MPEYYQPYEDSPYLVECPYCDYRMTRAEYPDHLRIFHPSHIDENGNDEPAERTLRRVGKARSPRTRDAPVGMRRCDECSALVPKSRIDEHMETRHSQQEDEPLDECSECGAVVRADRMEKHMRKVHNR